MSNFKSKVTNVLSEKLGYVTSISDLEWRSALDGALKDIYVNRFQLNLDADANYFLEVLISILLIRKRIERVG